MFLAGLKFALGLMTGVAVVFGIILGLMAVVDWVTDARKKFRRADQRMVCQAEAAIARRNHLFLLVRYPSWIDEPTEPTHRKSEFTQ